MFFCLDDESHGPGTWRGECFGLCPGHWERRGLQLQLRSPSFGSVDAFGFGPQIGLLGRNGLSPVLFLVCLSHLLSASVVRGAVETLAGQMSPTESGLVSSNESFLALLSHVAALRFVSSSAAQAKHPDSTKWVQAAPSSSRTPFQGLLVSDPSGSDS